MMEIIDIDCHEQASKIADIHDYYINGLPQKYNTIVGRVDVGLSQRQK